MFGEQQLLIDFSTIFVIHMPNITTTSRSLNNKHTKGQDFKVNFEVCNLFFSFVCFFSILVCRFLNEIPILFVM